MISFSVIAVMIVIGMVGVIVVRVNGGSFFHRLFPRR
jgi:hypothetical protein